MQINSAVFGPLEVDSKDVFHLSEGLYGFDAIHQYALISREDEDVTWQWFQAVDDAVPCFVVFNPYDIVDGYYPEIEKNDLRALGCQNPEDLSYLVIAVVPEDVTHTTVNLKSPIILNRRTRTARQVILSNRDYPIRFPIVDAGDEPGEQPLSGT